MPKASDGQGEEDVRQQIIGLGERSFRKSYYPELQRRMAELERLRMLLDRSSDMVFVLQVSSGRLLDFNDPVLVQLGATREELSRLSLYELVDEQAQAAVVEAVSRKPTTPATTTKLTARLGRSFGERLPVELSVTTATIGGAPTRWRSPVTSPSGSSSRRRCAGENRRPRTPAGRRRSSSTSPPTSCAPRSPRCGCWWSGSCAAPRPPGASALSSSA